MMQVTMRRTDGVGRIRVSFRCLGRIMPLLQRTAWKSWKALVRVFVTRVLTDFSPHLIWFLKIQHVSFSNVSRALRAHFYLLVMFLFLLKIQLFTCFCCCFYLKQIMLFFLFSKLWHKATFSAMAILATYPHSSLKLSNI